MARPRVSRLQDIEGNDDGAHHGNVFTQAVLDLMGELSVLAKQGGYLVAMAPAQSYLDCTTDQFSRKVNFPPVRVPSIS